MAALGGGESTEAAEAEVGVGEELATKE
jgi:hypothetical protein